MERKRFSVLFFIKRSKLLKNGEAPVRVRVTYDRLYVELQLKRSVKVPLWSQEKEKSTGKDRNSVELNHYIDALRVKFYQIYQDLELEGKIISARAIVNRYQGKDETFKTLYNVFKEHNDNCRKLIGTDYADITVRRYDNCLKYLMELVKRDYKVDDMLLREVNGELVRKFDLYLKTEKGSPDKSGGKFFNSIENLHLCTMNNQGLLALAQLILPSEILSNFEVVRVEEEASLIRIYLDESVKAEYKENPEIESKGFCEAVTIRDFPIRDKGVDLIVRRRKWYDKQNNRYFSDSYDLKAEETRYSKEFAAFLKGVYGDDSYDLPFA